MSDPKHDQSPDTRGLRNSRKISRLGQPGKSVQEDKQRRWSINHWLDWYATKIGKYDQKPWELNSEQRLLMTLETRPVKIGKVPNNKLLDVDLLRGSTFEKAKPEYRLSVVVLMGICRSLFLPLCLSWWSRHTSPRMALAALLIYVVLLGHVITLRLGASDLAEEIAWPCLAFLAMGQLLSYIAVTETVLTDTAQWTEGGASKTVVAINVVRVSDKNLRRKSSRNSSRKASPDTTAVSDAGSDQFTAEAGAYATVCVADEMRSRKSSDMATSERIAEKYDNVNSYQLTADAVASATFCVNDGADDSRSRKSSKNSSDKATPEPMAEKDDNADSYQLTADAVAPAAFCVCGVEDESRSQKSSTNNSEEVTFELIAEKYDNTASYQLTADAFCFCESYDESPNRKSSKNNSEEAAPQPMSENDDDPDSYQFTADGAFSTIVFSDTNRLKSHLQVAGGKAVSVSMAHDRYADVDFALECLGNNFSNCAGGKADLDCLSFGGSCNSAEDFDRFTMDSQLSDTDRLTTPVDSDASVESDSIMNSCSSESESEEDEVKIADLFNKSQSEQELWLQRPSRSIFCFLWPPQHPRKSHNGDENDPPTCAPPRKVQLTMLDIGWSIIQAVKRAPSWASRNSLAHILLPAALSAAVPLLCLRWLADAAPAASWLGHRVDKPLVGSVIYSCRLALSVLCRFGIHCGLYFMLCVADRTLWQRFLFAKHFCFLTSSRRAQKYQVPHFRLNKPRNIKIWLSLRSYLRRRGPQRSLGAVTTMAFYIFLVASCVLCWLLLSRSQRQLLSSPVFFDALLMFASMGCFLLRYLHVGTRINRKFRDQTLLVTEQLNLCLAMESKPNKKSTLTLANNMLKLTADLLKVMDRPYRIGGLVVNPVFYNALKVVIMSALSEVLSKFFGFKFMLDRISVNPDVW